MIESRIRRLLKATAFAIGSLANMPLTFKGFIADNADHNLTDVLVKRWTLTIPSLNLGRYGLGYHNASTSTMVVSSSGSLSATDFINAVIVFRAEPSPIG